MDLTSIGFLAGVIFSVIFLGFGYIAGRSEQDDRADKGSDTGQGTIEGYNTGQLSNFYTNDNLSITRNSDRWSNNRCNVPITKEEIVFVLQMILHVFRHNLSIHEKECIEAAIVEFDEDNNSNNKEEDKIIPVAPCI